MLQTEILNQLRVPSFHYPAHGLNSRPKLFKTDQDNIISSCLPQSDLPMMFQCLLFAVVLAALACSLAAPAPGVIAAYTVPAASAHVVPGSPFVTGYSHQAVHHVARSGAIVAAAPLAYHAASPYVAAPLAYHAASPYYSSPLIL